MEASEEELEGIHEVGPQVAHSIHTFFRQEGNRRVIRRLLEAGVKPSVDEGQVELEHPLAGKTVVFTGTLEAFSRDEARSRVEALGSKVASSISAKTDFLVAGADPGSKYRKAKDLGVSILTEDDFLQMLESR